MKGIKIATLFKQFGHCSILLRAAIRSLINGVGDATNENATNNLASRRFADTRQMLALLLEDMGAYCVLSAANGKEALTAGVMFHFACE